MNKDNTNCSRTPVERYLLNKMTPGEETAFQEHLRTCSACKAYLDTIRNVALFVSDEPLPTLYPTPHTLHPVYSIKKIFHSPFFSIAACLLLVCGTGIYLLMHNPAGTPHDTHIMRQNRDSTAYVDTTWTLLSPAQPVGIVNPANEPVVFRWDREGSFRLQLETGGKIVADIDGTGTACTLDSALAARYEQLNWTLTIAGKEHKGKLIIQTK